MVLIGVFLVLVPVVFGSDQVHALKKASSPRSVRHLKANETVNTWSSDLTFTWEKCVICDGYDVRLFLESNAGKREIPYKLKSAVTALKITDLPPRTIYKLVVRKLPSEVSSSEVSGRCYAPKAPLPVENLVARPLTRSSFQLEWDSKDADGFLVRVCKNGSEDQEFVISRFYNHSFVTFQMSVSPETVYQIQVFAFFSPRTEESTSTAVAASVKTLPEVLPTLNLSWEFKWNLKLLWTNPASPSPVTHRLRCVVGQTTTFFDADLSGSTEFVALPEIPRTHKITCTLQTWFSEDDSSKTETRLSIPREKWGLHDSIWTRLSGPDGYAMTYSASSDIERIDGAERLLIQFYSGDLSSNCWEVQYKLCEKTGVCEDSWSSLRWDYRIFLKPGDIKAWTPYKLLHRFYYRCHYETWPPYTTTEELELPVITGPPEPVSEFSHTKSGLAWVYNSSLSPDYFLLTYCAEEKCTSQSVPGDDRSVTLGHWNGSLIYDATIQAVALRNGSAYVSPSEIKSFAAPNSPFYVLSENVTVDVEEIVDSPNVKLIITHNSSLDVVPVVDYHIEVCGTPARIWEDEETARTLGSNTTCKTIASTNSSVELNREPWISYKVVHVLICHPAFDTDNPVDITLPIFKQNPKPTSNVYFSESWYPFLEWSREPPTPSGFFIKICPALTDSAALCYHSQAGPLAQLFDLDRESLPVGEVTGYITPFVKFEGSVYNGTSTKIPMGTLRQPPSEIR